MTVNASSLDVLRKETAQRSTANDPNEIGGGAFIKLMITQFQNQDPFKPMDSTQLLGQLAQFSTVSGIQDMQLSLGTLVDSLRSSQMLGGAALIGRQVLAPAEAIDHVAGTTVQGAVQLPDGTSAASVQIRDSAGQLVGRFELPASSGLQPFTWNGMTTTGEVAKGGRYSIEVVARVGADSESVPVQIVDEVRSVSLDPATQEITVNTAMLGSVPLSQVQQIG